MRHGALLDLLVSRLTILFAVFGLFPAIMALFVPDARSAGPVIGLSFLVCAQVGGFVSQRMMTARRCGFAWTLPGFRRELLRQFVGCGVAVSLAGGLIPAAIATGTTMPSLAVGATGFAAFSLGGVLCLIPEAPPLLMLASWALFFLVGTSTPAALLDTPVAVFAIALAISTAALWLGFRSRAFRWSALDALGGKVGVFSTQMQSLLRWPKRTRRQSVARRDGASPEAASRAPYVGTSVFRGVISSYHSARRPWLFVNLVAEVVVFALMTAAFVWLNRVTDGPAASENVWFGLVMVGSIFSSMGRGLCSRVGLPWSRRHHLAVAYALDLLNTLGFLLATCPLAIVVFIVIAHPDGQLIAALARAGAATAVFLPVFQWPGRPPTGGPGLGQLQKISWVTFIRPLVIVSVVGLCVYGLPVIVSSLVAQAIVLATLLVASQALYWLKLRHAFITCDLVGQET